MPEGWDEEGACIDIIMVGDNFEDGGEVGDGTAKFKRVKVADLESVFVGPEFDFL
jgi:hypothetical protein